jgi:hypothetical protein
MGKRVKSTLLAVAMAFAVVVPSVEAASISFNDGVNPVWVVADNSPDDLNPLLGWITASGGWADTFLFFAETGITKPILGSSSEPIMFADISATSGGGTHTLVVTFSETDFGPSSLDGFIGGTVSTDGEGSVTYALLQDPANALFSGGVLAFDVVNGPAAATPILEDFTLAINAYPYSLTQAFVIQHTSPNLQSTDIEAVVAIPNVPDGGATLALLGMGIIGLGAIRRKLSL